MHGQIGGPYYKGSGPSGVVKAAQADNTVHNSPGRGGQSFPAQPIAGPENPGPPISMRKALASRGTRLASGQFADNVSKTPSAGALRLGNMIPARGALPIMVGDEIIGAAGASGAPGGDKDEACVKAGLDKVAADLK